MFGTLITTAASLLVASLVSGDTVVNLLLVGDSSIGQSDIGVVGGVVHGSIIGSVSLLYLLVLAQVPTNR